MLKVGHIILQNTFLSSLELGIFRRKKTGWEQGWPIDRHIAVSQDTLGRSAQLCQASSDEVGLQPPSPPLHPHQSSTIHLQHKHALTIFYCALQLLDNYRDSSIKDIDFLTERSSEL